MKLSDYKEKLKQNVEYNEAYEELKPRFEVANAVLRGRLKKGWSQEELAETVGTKQANISRIEAGLSNPTLSLLQKIFHALDLELKVFSKDEVPPPQVRVEISSIGVSSNAYPVNNWPKSPCSPEYVMNGAASSEAKGRF
jgi:transcriptional regulator with XRE-family HTH domain